MAILAFVLFAGSVVCLASGQPTMMTDCGNQMNNTVAVCPYMSASIPAISSTTFSKELASLIVLVVLVLTVMLYGVADRIALAKSYELRPQAPPISYLNSTLNLISRGVLHPRIYGF